MSTQEILAWGSGVGFLLLLLGIAVFIIIRGDKNPVPHAAMVILRVILAFAGAGFAAVLPGFLQIAGSTNVFAIRAGGTLAAFAVVYFFNPPLRVQNAVLGPAKPKQRVVNRAQIEPDLPSSDANT